MFDNLEQSVTFHSNRSQ